MRYVALGDSYAAGVGGGARRNACWRADDGYPVQVARRLSLDVAYNACLGATIADVAANQVEALGADTTHVSITLGGNDIGFVPVLIAAAEPGWMTNSDVSIDHAVIAIRRDLPGRLDGLYADIAARAPQARVLVTGYPRLFNGVDCNLATFFSAHEMARLNAAADELGSTIAAAARRAGFTYAGVGSRFSRHAVCDDPEWINGVSWPLEGSFHPNALGHTAYADVVSEAFARLMPQEPSAADADVSIIDGPCVPGSAPTFALPDLLSARSLDGAREFGINPAEVESLAHRLYDGLEAAQQPGVVSSGDAIAAAARLRELDATARARRGEVRMDG